MPNLDPKMAMKSIVDFFGTSSVAGPSTRYSSHTSYRLNQTQNAESPEEYYRKNLSIPFVEHLLSELVTRFSLQQQKAINVLYLVPSNAIVQQESQFYTAMQEVVNLYKDDLPSPMCIQSELHCWYQKWKNDTCIPPCTTLETLKETNAALFPNIHVLLRIICTLQVTSCECERSFSAL